MPQQMLRWALGRSLIYRGPQRLGLRSKSSKTAAVSNVPEHVGSVGSPYRKHILLGTSQPPASWAPKLEKTDTFMKQLSPFLDDSDAGYKVSASTDATTNGESGTRTIRILPGNTQLVVPENDGKTAAKAIQQHPTDAGNSRNKTRHQILVCVHGQRDCRCGEQGVRLFDSLKKEIENRGLSQDIEVSGVSHIGGHKYAGNAIVYPRGDWYGLLDSPDAKSLISAVLEDRVWWDRWRGRMDLTKDQEIALYQQSTSVSALAPHPQTKVAESISVTYIMPDNTTKTLSVPCGKRLMEVGKEADIPTIDGTCGGNLECATCHIIVDPAYASKLPPVTEEEEDILEYAIGRTPNSRLSCQLTAKKDLDGLRLQVASPVPKPFPARSFSTSARPILSITSILPGQSRLIPTPPFSRSFSAIPSSQAEGPRQEQPEQSPPKRDIKSLTREYGPIAVAVYLTFSFSTFLLCLGLISTYEIDAAKLSEVFTTLKSYLGIAAPSPSEVEEEAEPKQSELFNLLPERFRTPEVRAGATMVLLAMAMTKLFLPIKLGLTAAVTPLVAKRLRTMGFHLGTKGGYKDAAVRVKSEVKVRTDRVKERADRVKEGVKERAEKFRDRE
ncbi:Sucrase/ferredoxin-like-domain-containing protein [Phlyctochytrium arcticum]|nr:Sucrase/ferredoxin-like-domain-containing protein [Phlyctochytrium arcticum]